MKKRVFSILLSLCMAATLLTPMAYAWSSEQDSLYTTFGANNDISTKQLGYMEEIYEYLTGELGLNTAASCGLLANMYRESRFDPAVNSSSSTTIGICQWYGSNRTKVINWCQENGYDPYTLEGQLGYLTHLFRDTGYDGYAGGYYIRIYEYLLGVENTAQGAYDAAYHFCYYFEIPSDKVTTATSRGNLAMNTFFPFYEQLGLTDGGTNDNDVDDNNGGLPFTDVDAGDWFYEVVAYAYEQEMVSGVTDTLFDPDGTMTRAQAVQILYNMNGSPTTTVSSPFEDVSDGDWYKEAIDWAWATGCINGVSATQFSPDGVLTREQMAQILYNYYTNFLGYEAADLASLSAYTDSDQVTFGATAMQWSVGNGIITGINENGTNYLRPQSECTRAQGCAMLVRLVQFLAE